MGKNHYETLGVDRNATAADIKRAYRSKARQTHPDKGGDAAEFAAATDAYEVLTDPQRKLLYDATGADRVKPVEAEAREVLIMLFRENLLKAEPGKVLIYINAHLNQLEERFAAERRQLQDREKKLKEKRKKIKSKKENLAHFVIDGELLSIEQGFNTLDRRIAVQKACQKMMKAYSEEKEEPQMTSIYFGGAASVSGTVKLRFE